MFASVIVVLFVAVLTGGWKDFRTALVATGCTLACFAVWHLLRSPWMMHKHLYSGSHIDNIDGTVRSLVATTVPIASDNYHQRAIDPAENWF